jgi:hypothetical protein
LVTQKSLFICLNSSLISYFTGLIGTGHMRFGAGHLVLHCRSVDGTRWATTCPDPNLPLAWLRFKLREFCCLPPPACLPSRSRLVSTVSSPSAAGLVTYARLLRSYRAFLIRCCPIIPLAFLCLPSSFPSSPCHSPSYINAHAKLSHRVLVLAG